MIVSVLNTKGGVGKTTVALNLAIARALCGGSVLAIDGDRQGSLITALANREAAPAIACAHYPDGKILRQQVRLARDKYADIIIDAGGRDSTALRAALSLADRVLIPFAPRSFDVWALDDMAHLLSDAREADQDGREFSAWAFLSQADSRGRDNGEAAGAMPAGIKFLDCPVGRRKAIADAAGLGRSVLESGTDTKATAEIERLVTAVFR